MKDEEHDKLEEEYDKLEVAYYRRFGDFAIYPSVDLSVSERIDLLRQALETGKMIEYPLPEPGTDGYIYLQYIKRFGPVPYFYMPIPGTPEFYERLRKALETGVPVQKPDNLPPDTVF